MNATTLSNWKAIASYLSVNVRTAQRYEAERGLPVRRGPGKGNVTASTADLDNWMAAPPPSAPLGPTSWYRWPVGPGVIAELRFLGDPTPEQIETLREYLNLVKAAIKAAA